LERLRVRVYVVSVLLLAVGGIVLAVPKPRPQGHDERWMEDLLPTAVDSSAWAKKGASAVEKTETVPPGFLRYAFIPGTEGNPRQSHAMDRETYEILAPLIGIVWRDYAGAGIEFDVAVIASSSRSSFHDPRVCFAGHGWDFDNQSRDVVTTRDRGDVPMTILQGADESGLRYVAAYLYKGPEGFSASTVGVKWQMLLHLLIHPFDTSSMGVFYRFIARDLSTSDLAEPAGAQAEQAKGPREESKENFKRFIADYLDAANASSKGVF